MTPNGPNGPREVARFRRLMDRLRRPSTPVTPTESMMDGIDPNTGADAETINDGLAGWMSLARDAPGREVVAAWSEGPMLETWPSHRLEGILGSFHDDGAPLFVVGPGISAEVATDRPAPLRYECPFSMAPQTFDRLLDFDPGTKSKLLYVTFPGDRILRRVVRAKQSGWTVVYDAQVDWEALQRAAGAGWYQRGFEWYLVREADVVIAASDRLTAKVSASFDRDDVHTVYNAAVVADGQWPREPARPPIIGCVGGMNPGLDLDRQLLVETALRYPTWTFHLIEMGQANRVRLPDNVRSLGPHPPGEWARLSRLWTGAMIPLLVNELSPLSDPIEAHQFLALGLPLVSSYFSSLRGRPGAVVVESPADFVEEVGKLPGRVADDGASAWLGSNRWQDRIDQIRALIRAVATVGEMGTISRIL